MKRNMELVRAILFCFEQSEKDRIDPKAIQVEGYTSEEVRFHIELMKEGGAASSRDCHSDDGLR